MYYCNRMWTQYVRSEERWPLNGSLNYYTISQLEVFCKRASCTGSCSNCPPPMPPWYSLPPVSPTCGYQIEVSLLTLGAQEPDLVSPAKTPQGPQFGLGAASAAGQFPLRWYPVRGQGDSLGLEASDSNFPTGAPGNFDSGEQVDWLPSLFILRGL